MTTLSVEKGIPLVEPSSAGRPRLYPFYELDIGDSFFVPNGDPKRIKPAASHAGKRHNKKFATRKVDGGIRVWRVE